MEGYDDKKTFLVYTNRTFDAHSHELYDDWIEVDNDVNSGSSDVTLRQWGDRIRGRLRKLHAEAESEEVEDLTIYVNMDAPLNYDWILKEIKMHLEHDEKIMVDLVYVPEEETINLSDEMAKAMGIDVYEPTELKIEEDEDA